MESSAKWDQAVFDETLRKYVVAARKDFVTVLNSKGFFIARKALWFTEKADSKKITEFRKMRNPAGGLIVGMLVNKRRAKKGERGLYGKPMNEAIAIIIAAKRRSVAFMKSGWIPSIQALDPKAEDKQLAAPRVSGAKQVGAPKGSASTATEFHQVCQIINTAQAKRDKSNALDTIGKKALVQAFQDETRSMNEYIEKKLKKATAAANAKL